MQVKLRQAQQQVWVEVWDQGPGIDADAAEELTQAFRRRDQRMAAAAGPEHCAAYCADASRQTGTGQSRRQQRTGRPLLCPQLIG